MKTIVEVEMAGLLKGMPSSALSALLDRLDQLEQSNQDLADQVSDLQTTVDNFSAKELPVGTVIELNFIPTNINTLMGYGVWVEDTARAGRVGVGRGTVTDTRGVPSTFTVGAVGGETAHVQTIDEMAEHDHNPTGITDLKGGTTQSGAGSGAASYPLLGAQTMVKRGGGQAMNIMQPYIVRTYWVRTG